LLRDYRDVSYIYVGEKYRNNGYAKILLNHFVRKSTAENKIPYYSFADGEASERLVRQAGFIPCAYRYEIRPLFTAE
jgi:predicted GNAT family acetyltransferase